MMLGFVGVNDAATSLAAPVPAVRRPTVSTARALGRILARADVQHNSDAGLRVIESGTRSADVLVAALAAESLTTYRSTRAVAL